MSRSEKRRHHRAAYDGLVVVDGRRARGVDVSVGGMRVANIDPSPDIGTEVLVEFALPAGGAVATRAEVLRVENGVYVLRFVRLDPATMLSLIKFSSPAAA